jgi:hypothetical protein
MSNITNPQNPVTIRSVIIKSDDFETKAEAFCPECYENYRSESLSIDRRSSIFIESFHELCSICKFTKMSIGSIGFSYPSLWKKFPIDGDYELLSNGSSVLMIDGIGFHKEHFLVYHKGYMIITAKPVHFEAPRRPGCRKTKVSIDHWKMKANIKNTVINLIPSDLPLTLSRRSKLDLGVDSIIIDGFQCEFHNGKCEYSHGKRSIKGYTFSNNVLFSVTMSDTNKIILGLKLFCVLDGQLTLLCEWAKSFTLYEHVVNYNQGSYTDSKSIMLRSKEEFLDYLINKEAPHNVFINDDENRIKYNEYQELLDKKWIDIMI